MGPVAASPIAGVLVGLPVVGRALVHQEPQDVFDVAFALGVGLLLWPNQLVIP